MLVLARARVGLYEPRGEYQLIVEHLEEAGEGALKREFEKLKAKLAAEGLFAAERKRALPAVPRRIGVVTSPTGAAVHDILRVLRARFPAATVLVYPTAVQGAAAVPEIVRAIEAASRRQECDVLIVARGGGSMEDLWCFNDERVARAFDYVQSLGKIPIVVNDSRGFFTSRVFGTFVMEGAAMVGEGIPAAVVEQAGIQAGMPVGPLAVLDETALSLSVHVLDQTRTDYRAEGGTYIAAPGELLVERMVKEFDRNGRAAGAGFYEYPEEKGAKKFLWPELKNLFEKPGAAWDMQELKDRLLYRQAVETARCLSEGVLTTVHDANIGSIFGIGFPAWTGGALQFIYGMGIEAFTARAAQLADKHGPGFAVTPAVQDALRKHQPQY